jgi:hypothetical protein
MGRREGESTEMVRYREMTRLDLLPIVGEVGGGRILNEEESRGARSLNEAGF